MPLPENTKLPTVCYESWDGDRLFFWVPDVGTFVVAEPLLKGGNFGLADMVRVTLGGSNAPAHWGGEFYPAGKEPDAYQVADDDPNSPDADVVEIATYDPNNGNIQLFMEKINVMGRRYFGVPLFYEYDPLHRRILPQPVAHAHAGY